MFVGDPLRRRAFLGAVLNKFSFDVPTKFGLRSLARVCIRGAAQIAVQMGRAARRAAYIREHSNRAAQRGAAWLMRTSRNKL